MLSITNACVSACQWTLHFSGDIPSNINQEFGQRSWIKSDRSIRATTQDRTAEVSKIQLQIFNIAQNLNKMRCLLFSSEKEVLLWYTSLAASGSKVILLLSFSCVNLSTGQASGTEASHPHRAEASRLPAGSPEETGWEQYLTTVLNCVFVWDLELQKTQQFKAAEYQVSWGLTVKHRALCITRTATLHCFFQKRQQINKQKQVQALSTALHLLFFTAHY